MIRTRFYILLLLLASASWLTSCSSSADQLDDQISDALDDNTLDESDADALRVFVAKESKALGKDKKTVLLLTPDGKLDESALLAYIKRNRTYRKLVKEGKNPTVSLGNIASSGKPLRLKLYLEASGSMFPYDAPGGNGAFKRTLNDLLTEFDAVNPNQGKLFLISHRPQ